MEFNSNNSAHTVHLVVDNLVRLRVSTRHDLNNIEATRNGFEVRVQALMLRVRIPVLVMSDIVVLRRTRTSQC